MIANLKTVIERMAIEKLTEREAELVSVMNALKARIYSVSAADSRLFEQIILADKELSLVRQRLSVLRGQEVVA